MSPDYDERDDGTQPLPLPLGAGPPRWSAILRALRGARGITQEGWAARIGVSRKTVQRWESGSALPDARAEGALLAACMELGLFQPGASAATEFPYLTVDAVREALANARLAHMRHNRYRLRRASHHLFTAGCRAH